jgi:signal transduction histidine kinase
MMVEHLIRNAQDATADSGTVRIEVSLERNVEADSIGSSGVFPVLQAVRGAPAMPNPAQPGDPEPAGQRLDFACLTVSDSGSGMTAEFIRERLFRPFDSTKGSKGMGIGAYQVREYVHALGGRIRVRSAPGQGTTVTLRLPACP